MYSTQFKHLKISLFGYRKNPVTPCSKTQSLRSAYRQLSSSFSKCLINIEEYNPQLFSFVEELQQIKKLRLDIIRMKVYLSCCPLATDSRLLLRLAKQQHFVDSHSDYTLNDLFEINSGKLIDFLTDVHADFARHIKLDCEKCQGQYFYF